MPSLLATLGLNVTPFERNLNDSVVSAREAGRHIAEALTNVAGEKLAELGSIAAIGETIRSSVELGEKIYDLSRRLGISTDAVQLWDSALRKNSSSIESAVGFFEKLGVARDKILQGKAGSAALIDDFKQLGVSIDDLRTKRIEDVAAQIAQAFSEGDTQQLIGALRSVGGRAAGEMVAAFRGGLSEMIDPNQTKITIINPDQVALLKEAADDAKTLWINLKGAAAELTAGLVERKNAISEAFKVTGATVTGFAKGFWSKFSEEDQALGAGKKSGITKLMEAFSEGNKQSLKGAQDAQKKVEDEIFKRQEERAKSRRTGPLADEESNSSLTKNEIKELDQLAKKRDELAKKRADHALAEMSDKEKLIELDRRKAEIESKFEMGMGLGTLDEEGKIKLETELEDIRHERRGVEDRFFKEPQEAKTARIHPDVNQLQRIGAYSSDQGRAVEQIAQHVQSINQQIGQLVKEAKKGRY